MPVAPPLHPKLLRLFSLRLMREIVGGLGWKYRAYVAGYIAVSAVFLLPPLLLKFFTERSMDLKDITGWSFLSMLLVFGGGIAVSLWAGVFFSSIFSEWLRLTLSIRLRRRVLEGLHTTRLEALDRAERGDWLTRLSGDMRSAEYFLADAVPEQIRQAVLMLGTAVLFLIYSGPVALVPCAFALLLAWLNVGIQQKMAPSLGQAREQEGRIFQFLIESFEGLRTIRSYRGEAFVTKRLNEGLRRLFEVCMRIIRKMGGLMGVNEFGSQMVTTAVLCLAAWSLLKGRLTAEDVLIYPFYLALFLTAAKTLVAGAYEWNRFFMEGGRLAYICFDPASRLPENTRLDFDPSRVRRIEVKGLGFSYAEQAVLKDFNLEVLAGQTLALMGPSGCGKSTVLEILAGLRSPDEGTFTVETGLSAPAELTCLPVAMGAYVEQRPYLLAGTFRENLTFGLQVEDERIWGALYQLDMVELTGSRGGLAGTIRDRGMNLSEGQRYRIALARALLARRPLLLLDEPFAALDEESVKSVVKALNAERVRGVAVIVVTHYLPPGLAVDQTVRMG